jgi:hypothetical protein
VTAPLPGDSCDSGGGSAPPAVLLAGELHAPVRGWEGGSVWGVGSEGGRQVSGAAGGPLLGARLCGRNALLL